MPAAAVAEPGRVGVAGGAATAPSGLREVEVRRHGGAVESDVVAVEAPLEIQIDGEPIVVTMRTPGDDLELAAGFLYGEGLIESRDDLLELMAPDPGPRLQVLDDHGCRGAAVVAARLRSTSAGAALEAPVGSPSSPRPRAFRATAACGVCGKQRLEDLSLPLGSIEPLPLSEAVLESLPERLRRHQLLFERCGGIHGAGLFDASGDLLCLREDVGRHNAVDKVIGWSLLRGEVPLRGRVLAVSGRAGFEIVQKAIRAEIPVLVAVGAASSAAVDLARGAGMALHTFVAPGRGNLHV